MLLKIHKNIIMIGFILSLLSLGLLLGGGYVLWSVDFTVSEFQADSLPWWAFEHENKSFLLFVVISLFVLVLYSIAVNLGLRDLFRKTGSPELFYLMLFVITLSFEVFRIGIVLIKVWSLPSYLTITLTQAVLCSRFFALLCLLVSSLYAVGMKYGRLSTILLIMLIVSIALAGIFPIDSTKFSLTLLHKLGDNRGYWYINAGLGFLMLLNFLAASVTRKDKRFLVTAGASVLLFLGKELLYFGVSPFPIGAGTVMLVAGILLFSRQIGVYYLWI